MRNAISELLFLRQNIPLSVDYNNSNRYRIVVFEQDKSRTSYYFSSPIYNTDTGKLVKSSFNKGLNGFYLVGSNSYVEVLDRVFFRNSKINFEVNLNTKGGVISGDKIKCHGFDLIPTINGIAILTSPMQDKVFSFDIHSSKPFMNSIENDRCFAIMESEHTPFFTVACIGSTRDDLKIIGAAVLKVKKNTERDYSIKVSSIGGDERILLEINLYEPKILQDTTVESNSPSLNNAFGNVAFVGLSDYYGEQWLYTKFDFQKMRDIENRYIHRFKLYVPLLSENYSILQSFSLASRFCSFGSTWDNKITSYINCTTSSSLNNYMIFDLTNLMVDSKTMNIKRIDGIVTRIQNLCNPYTIVGTGDGYLFPSIIEVNHQ